MGGLVERKGGGRFKKRRNSRLFFGGRRCGGRCGLDAKDGEGGGLWGCRYCFPHSGVFAFFGIWHAGSWIKGLMEWKCRSFFFTCLL